MLRKSPESKGPYFTSSRFGNQDYPYVEESRRERTGRSLKRYSEPYLNDLSSGIECRIMNLMTLLEQARDGEVLSNGPLFPWNRQQVEARRFVTARIFGVQHRRRRDFVAHARFT